MNKKIVGLAVAFLSAFFLSVSPENTKAASVPGVFHVSQEVSGSWGEVFAEPFGVTYETKEFSATPDGSEVKVRVSQEGLPFAGVDRVSLSACGTQVAPEYARYVSNSESVLPWVSAVDLDVVGVHEGAIEFLWNVPEGCDSQTVLTLTANAYRSVEGNALYFPAQGLPAKKYQFRNNGSLSVDGRISEVDGIASPDYQVRWTTTTGHPSATTSIYMRDDADSVYLAFDIPTDNTDDFGADWLKVFAMNSASGTTTEYRVDDSDALNGACAFGTTTRASYRHQTCEVRIPKSGLSGNFLDFSARYYGTAAEERLLAEGNITSAFGDASPEFTMDLQFRYTNVASSSFRILDSTESSVIVPATACVAQDGTYDDSPETVLCSIGQDLDFGTTYVFELSVTDGDDIDYVKTVYFPFEERQRFSTLHEFDEVSEGTAPFGDMVVYEGRLYGTNLYGGDNDGGTIFSMALDGSDVQILYHFSEEVSGASPAGLVELDGKLFGATLYGLSASLGGLFSINPDGTGFQVLRQWTFENGYVAGNIFASDGKIRGVEYDYDNGGIIVFSINPDGSDFDYEYLSLNAFETPLLPYDDKLYGVEQVNSNRQLFSIDLDGTDYQPLYSWDCLVMGCPLTTRLIEHSGRFYGVNNNDDTQYNDLLFSVNPDGTDFQLLEKTDQNSILTSYDFDEMLFSGDAIYGFGSMGHANQDYTVDGKSITHYSDVSGEAVTIVGYNSILHYDVVRVIGNNMLIHGGRAYFSGEAGIGSFDLPYLSYSAGANGSISGNATQTPDYNGSGAAVTAVPDSGYMFVSWSDGVATASRTDSGVTARVSATASFEVIASATPVVEVRRSRSGGGSGRRATPATGAASGAVSAPSSVIVTPSGVPAVSTVTSPSGFSSNLSVGSSDPGVRTLQAFLNSRGFKVSESGAGSPGLETDYFGSRTRDALARFQASVGISPALGFFGPVTRAYIQAHP